MGKLLLASTSPRRRELLKQVAIPFEVVESSYEEPNIVKTSPYKLVEEQAKGKALHAIIPHSLCTEQEGIVVLGADTIVVKDGLVMGKPKTKEEAKRMLRLLSGSSHEVVTGIALYYQGKVETRHSITTVYFKSISDEDIEWYVESGEPLDKAGAYGIQGIGALWVDRIDGSYTNVVGLPVEVVFDMLRLLAIDVFLYQ